MSIVANPDSINSNKYLYAVYTLAGFKTHEAFLFFTGIIVLIIFITSNALSIFTTWIMLRFTHRQNHILSVRLLRHYLMQPYSFFLNRNTTELSKNLLAEVSNVVSHILIPGMQIIARLMVTFFILSFLTFNNPVLALLVVTILGTTYALIYYFIRKKITDIGKQRVNLDRNRYKISAEAFGGIKDLKLLGRESFFIKNYAVTSSLHAKHQALGQVIAQSPKYLVESVAFGGILAIVIYLIAAGQNIEKALPLISLYAIAGYRLLPALQQIFSNTTQIRLHIPSLNILHDDIKLHGLQMESVDLPQERVKNAATNFQDKLELKNVSFTYPNKMTACLEKLNISIPVKSTVGLVGPTGAGKTTLVDILLGLLKPQSGNLIVDGTTIDESNVNLWQKNIGYVPQGIFLFDDTIKRNIAYAIDDKDIDQSSIERAARIANIHDFIVNELPNGYDSIVGERGVRLSGGQRQRIGIARALYHDPEFLILDEATSALDGVTEGIVMEAIKTLSHKKTMVIIAHRLSTIKECDTIYLLKNGQIEDQGTYQHLIANSNLFRSMAAGSEK